MLKGNIFNLYNFIENAEYKYPNLKTKINFLLDNFIKFMIRTRRFNQAIICFSKCKNL